MSEKVRLIRIRSLKNKVYFEHYPECRKCCFYEYYVKNVIFTAVVDEAQGPS